MEKRNLLLKLQRKYQEGGYALVTPQTGRVIAFGEDLKDLYTIIDKEKIKDADKLVMHIPPPKVKHVFRFPLSVRACPSEVHLRLNLNMEPGDRQKETPPMTPNQK